MTVKEAREIVHNFNEAFDNSDDDEFMFIEAMNFLIEEEKRPQDMMCLGGYYYELKHFCETHGCWEVTQSKNLQDSGEGKLYTDKYWDIFG